MGKYANISRQRVSAATNARLSFLRRRLRGIVCRNIELEALLPTKSGLVQKREEGRWRVEMLDFEVVEAFVQVVRQGSFQAAAVAQNVTPSAISKRIARLEAQVGARLINRSTHEFTLTEAVGIFFERAKPILHEVGAAKEFIAEAKDEFSGTIRLHIRANPSPT